MTPSRHPFLILICMSLALFQIITALQVLQLPDAVASAVSIPVAWQVGLSTGWSLLFFVAALTLFYRKRWSVRLAGALIVLFVLYSLLRLVVFARADYDRARLPFLMMITVLLLALPVWRLMRPSRDA
jgi:hypothetical protein